MVMIIELHFSQEVILKYFKFVNVRKNQILK